jgi:hypothetical protein
MLYVEGQRLEKADKQFQNLYNNAIERLKEVSGSKDQFHVVFKVRPSDVSQLKTDDETYVNTTADEGIVFDQTVYEPTLNRTVNWVYSEKPLPEKNGEVDLSRVGMKWMFKQDSLTEIVKDQDLAFFLYHVDPRFGEREDNKKYQLVDNRGEAEREVESKRPEIKFQYTLYEKLPENEDNLQTVALAWGVERSGEKPVNTVLIELERAVRMGEQEKQRGNRLAKGIDEFLEDVKLGKKTRVKSLVQLASDNKIIKVSMQKNNMGVFWLDNYEALSEKIIDLTPRNVNFWKDILTDYLLDNENVLNILKSDLEIHENDPVIDMEYQEFFDRFFDKDMKKYTEQVALKCKINPKGKSKAALRDELLEYFKQNYGFEYKELQS